MGVVSIHRNFLAHYGILGMKWGVRRTSEQLGRHVIRKGTTMYRTTAGANDLHNGPTYVTHLKVDRDLYRGYWAGNIRMNSGKNGNGTAYEHKYKLKEDLKVPSREELRDTFNRVLSDDTLRRSAFQSYVDKQLVYYRSVNPKQTKEEYLQKTEKPVNELLSKYGDYSPTQLFHLVSGGLATSKPIQDFVIADLTKRGYNAMVDEYGVAGQDAAEREGVDPLFIFDSNKSLGSGRVSTISKREESRATRRYLDWKDKANRHANNGQW